MKEINAYFNEVLLSKSKKTIISKEKNPKDLDTLEVGDVVYGYYGYSVRLPRFYKIIKRKYNDFTVLRLKGKVTKGERNTKEWYEVATDEIYSDKELKGKLSKDNELKINGDVEALFYDGKELKGYAKI